ncbi:MAG TPA: HIT family protein, partial [Beijerinckiaceae bacterium]|nr:HIT family protein [Beijerinckiaceae bacterium]
CGLRRGKMLAFRWIASAPGSCEDSGMNETIRRFGYPATLIAENEHWVVLLRPAQPTLGSLILAAKGEATSFADLSEGAFAELQRTVADIERALGEAVRFEKINYLMLMMVDPHVHFHVVPRYEGERSACGVTVPDAGWPKVPALGEAVELEPKQIEALIAHFRQSWPR